MAVAVESYLNINQAKSKFQITDFMQISLYKLKISFIITYLINNTIVMNMTCKNKIDKYVTYILTF